MAGVAAEVADGNTSPSGRTISQGRGDGGRPVPTHVGRHASRGASFPRFANIALNGLDQAAFHDAGFRHVRYADDFVVLCQTKTQVKEAHDLVQHHLAQIGLSLSAEKTKHTRFREGFAFLGFAISAWSVTMRPKSVEKFKDKIRELTPRHHNLDAEVVKKVNAVVRGTANYFATSFSSVRNEPRHRWTAEAAHAYPV